jgi:murein DD-endopeptidase MepM/ murein hydrolase activator NlpD
LLNAPVDVQRLIRLLPSTPSSGPSASVRFHGRISRQDAGLAASSYAATRRRQASGLRLAQAHRAPRLQLPPTLQLPSLVSGAIASFAAWRHQLATASSRRPELVARTDGQRNGHATLPLVAILAVLVLAVATTFPTAPLGPTGGTNGDDDGPRVALAGAVGAGQVDDSDALDGQLGAGPPARTTEGGLSRLDPEALALLTEPGSGTFAPDGQATAGTVATEEDLTGPYFDDGTLVKPIFVDTSLTDGRVLLKTYRVRSGDTLVGIAHRFGVSMMTLWWANKLSAKDELHIGQVLTIPPVNGLVVTVKAGETLKSIASKYHVDADEVYEMNKLEDRNLVVGQTLILPGAVGKKIAEPRAPTQTSRPTTVTSSPVRTPPRYTGGSMRWPVVGGNNYISQYFHYGHYAIDIAADYGTKVVAAASGTVIFAGWKNNGGGYQVWIAHGSGLYTTYNHMSAITVGRGQSVGRGQQVGRVGQSGNATGPHLHFEVWRGPVWAGGTRVNPLIYL